MTNADILEMLSETRTVTIGGEDLVLRSPSLPKTMEMFSKYGKAFEGADETEAAVGLFGFAKEALKATVEVEYGLSDMAAEYLVGSVKDKQLSEVAKVAMEMCGLKIEPEDAPEDDGDVNAVFS